MVILTHKTDIIITLSAFLKKCEKKTKGGYMKGRREYKALGCLLGEMRTFVFVF